MNVLFCYCLVGHSWMMLSTFLTESQFGLALQEKLTFPYVFKEWHSKQDIC